MSFQNTLWQSENWEKFQDICENTTFRLQDILVIIRKLPFQKCFFEIPRAEIMKLSQDFWKELEGKAREEKAVFTRVFPSDVSGPPLTPPERGRISPSFQEGVGEVCVRTKGIPEIFPEHTLTIDLMQSEEDILKNMKQKGRYNIKMAKKNNVEVSQSDDVSEFYELVQETTDRDGFSGHPQEVYKHMIDAFGDDGLLLLAKYEDKIIAGGIFLFCDGACTYYYGASSNQHRNVMAPYAVQWEAIREAKKRGCSWYDFLGIAPENASKDHQLFGVSRFKGRFGGIRKIYAPAFEVVHRRWWDMFFRMARKIRGILKR